MEISRGSGSSNTKVMGLGVCCSFGLGDLPLAPEMDPPPTAGEAGSFSPDEDAFPPLFCDESFPKVAVEMDLASLGVSSDSGMVIRRGGDNDRCPTALEQSTADNLRFGNTPSKYYPELTNGGHSFWFTTALPL